MKLSIIGAGKLGKTFGHLWTKNKLVTISQIINSTEKSSQQACNFIGSGEPAQLSHFNPDIDALLFACPDDQISELSQRISSNHDCSKIIAFHSSGATPSSAIIGNFSGKCSFHPNLSFANPDKLVQDFPETLCGYEGNQPAINLVSPLFSQLGCELFSLQNADKTLYHGAAVFAANFIPVLKDIAKKLLKECEVDQEIADKIVTSFMQKSLDNCQNGQGMKTLTGPAARKDLKTVEKQTESITKLDPNAGKIYQAISKYIINNK